MKKLRTALLLLAVLLLLPLSVHAEEQTAVHTYDTPGEYTTTLTVTDEYGAESTQSITINVRGNEAPVITIVADQTSGLAPLTVNFTATVTDPDGDAMTYEWDFGDNVVVSELSPAHTFTTAGKYTSTFKATDSKNNTSEKSIVVAVRRIGGCSPW